jgi:hypothetical protein
MQQDPGSPGRDGIDPPPPPARSVRRPRRLLALVVAALLVVVGGAAAAAFVLMRGAGEELLQLVPASSEVVVTAYLDPSAGQKVNLMALAHRFPALRDDQRLRRQVTDAFDEALRSSGLTHQDVLPWLGSQVAVIVDLGPNDNVPTTSVLIASKDDAAAETALERALGRSLGTEGVREYRGVSMHVFGTGSSLTTYAIVRHVVVLSNHAIGLSRVIDVSMGTTAAIADDPKFVATTSALPQGRLGIAYVNPTEVVDQALSVSGLGLAAGSVPGLDTLRAIQGIGASLSAHPDGLAFDFTVRLDPSKLDPATRRQLEQPVHENRMVALVPPDSYAVATQQGVDASLRRVADLSLFTAGGERIRRRLGLDDTLAALTGDLAFEMGPGTGAVPVGGAVLVGVNDRAAVERTLDGLADLVLAARRREASAGPKARWRTSTYRGATIRYLDAPSISTTGFHPAYVVTDGAAIIGSSPAEIRRVLDTKGGSRPDVTASSAYTRALARVPTGGSTFYLNVAAVLSRLGPLLPPNVKANIDPLKTVVQGTSTSSSRITSRLFVEIR